MTEAASGRISILLGLMVLAFLGVGFYIVKTFESQVDPQEQHRGSRAKKVVEGEPFGPLPYDRRGRVPAICVDTRPKGKQPAIPLVRMTGALVGIVKERWSLGDLNYRRYRLDRERFESFIVALLGAAERSSGELEVRLVAPKRSPRAFRISESALRTLLDRSLEGSSPKATDLVALDLDVSPESVQQDPRAEAWPWRGLSLKVLAEGPTRRLDSTRDLDRAVRLIRPWGVWSENDRTYRVSAKPFITVWDREGAGR